MNAITLRGFLTADGKVTEYGKDKGSKLCNFNIAVKTGYGKYERTDFFNCVKYNVSDKFVEMMKKGTHVLVSGSVRTDNKVEEIKNPDGSYHKNYNNYFTINVEDIELLPRYQKVN